MGSGQVRCLVAIELEITPALMHVPHIEYYENGTVQAVGKLKDGKRDGYWKWYRPDGTKRKTGYFVNGKRTKEWMRYDIKGKLVKNV
jgi:antitoxin component YwqK of YwqJK toxin-antitoxin module